jgi:uncharacterized membrane protein
MKTRNIMSLILLASGLIALLGAVVLYNSAINSATFSNWSSGLYAVLLGIAGIVLLIFALLTQVWGISLEAVRNRNERGR